MTTRLNPNTTPRFEARAEKARRNKEAALNAFIGKKAEIDAMLARLHALSDDHFNCHPDEVGWAMVGTLEHYASLLKRITDSAFGEGEQACRAVSWPGARQHGSGARHFVGCERHGGQGSSVGWMPGWTPHGVQRPPAVSGRKASVHWCLRGARVAPASGWLPKNPALSLAMSRASPASIRISPVRNRKLPRGGPRPDPRGIPGSRRPPSTQRGERAFQRTLPILPSE